MSRKDFEAIAAAVAATGCHVAVDPLVAEGWQAAVSSVGHRLAEVLATANPRFDRARFLLACGLSVPGGSGVRS